MADKVFPSKNDINGGVTGDGRTLTELNLETLLHSIWPANKTISGGAFTVNSSLVATVGSGTAIIDGKYVEFDQRTISVADDDTSYVFVELSRDVDGNVDGIQLSTTTTDEGGKSKGWLKDKAIAGKVRTAGGAVQETFDVQEHHQGVVSGVYTGDGTATQELNLGGVPKLVIVTTEDPSASDENVMGFSSALDWRSRNLDLFGDRHFGFGIVQDATESITEFNRQGKSWSPGIITSGSTASTTLSVSGLATGKPIIPWFSWIASNPSWASSAGLVARVDSTGTVTVELYNGSTTSTPDISGTLYVMYRQSKIIPSHVKVETGGNQTWRPRITSTGFIVSGVSEGLNRLGYRYSYLAIF